MKYQKSCPWSTILENGDVKFCIRTSIVPSQMYSTHLMGKACFNNNVDKNIPSFLCSFKPYGLPFKHCDLPENCNFTKKSQDCSITSI